jgi:hypothetical protein
MLDQLTTLLLALGGWTIVLVASVKWVSDRVAQRLGERWARNRGIELEQFRAMTAQSQAVMDAALAAFGAGHNAAQERQLVALEVLWKGVVTLRTQAPPIGVLADILSDEEFASLNERRDLLRNHMPRDIPAETLKLMSSVQHVEEHRPFCGELAWALFFAYRGLYGRLLMTFEAGVREGGFVPWRQDPGIQQILKSVLDTEDYSKLMTGSWGGWHQPVS